MSLSADQQSGVLTVSGAAARPGWVELLGNASDFTLTDDGAVRVIVPVTGDLSALAAIDFRELQGAGADVEIEHAGYLSIYGSAQDDTISSFGAAGLIHGGGGSDQLVGGEFADRLTGGAGDDLLAGGGGDDRLIGGAGDDLIDGGAGFDTAVYSGNLADYDVSVEDGAFMVVDLRGRSPDGTDYIANVERLQFRDGFLPLPPYPSGLTAAVSNGTLTIAGEAALPGGFIQLIGSTSDYALADDGIVPAEVAVGGDQSGIATIDLRGLRSAGAFVDIEHDAYLAIFGSDQTDVISASGAAGLIHGGGGSDLLLGSAFGDRLTGGTGADVLFGDDGDDRLIGGAGFDLIDGGAGFDTAVYSGNLADYDLSFDGGALVVADLRRNNPDGIDLLANVERLQFRDGFYAVPAAPTDLDAVLANGVLRISGTPAPSAAVALEGSEGDLEFYEVGFLPFGIPIESDGSSLGMVDFRALAEGGASVLLSGDRLHLYGSAQDDSLSIEGSGSFIHGRAGFDVLEGGAGRDTLVGGRGDDTIFAGAGDDRLIGSPGDDLIDGGAGFDTAVYSGNRADYALTVEEGVFVIADLRPDSPDGVDRFGNVERLQFRDGFFAPEDLLPQPAARNPFAADLV